MHSSCLSRCPNHMEAYRSFVSISSAITHVSILILIAHERKLEAVSHPMSLRVYWVANFVVLCLLTASGIARFITVGGNFDTSMKVDDIVSIFVLPISAFLLFVAVKGTSGIVVGEQELGKLEITSKWKWDCFD
ncbi:ABC transporter C family member 4 [Camellia lanceoleosa]|uniref:ABC transporter C family member 4 n=1 Tax=Camellia lanceoleosa TaxID=1840588 RepID=A0ACC0HDP9_9ERIC|nr:ABC transporter C family member 4 [Camellia lanceoleosa]